MLALLLLAAAATSDGPVTLQATQAQVLRQQAARMAKAVVTGDHETLVKNMHPKLLEMLGGKQKALATLQRSQQRLAKDHSRIIDNQIDAPTACARSGTQLQCVLPQTVILRVPGGRLRSESELLAISNDQGKRWQFVDANEPDKLRKVLPELSPALPIHGRKPSQLLSDE